MIQRIRVRFIGLAMAALFVLLAAIVTGINLINYRSVIDNADTTLELLSQNKGTFPDLSDNKKLKIPANMSMEAPYESRYFSVLLSENGDAIQTDTSRIKAIDAEAAVQYANQALLTEAERAFIGNYRFIQHKEGPSTRITFLDCGRKMDAYYDFLYSTIFMALAGYVAFFLVLLFFSKRILRPITESYEKQKRFITDAGHELKTPLAIIKADVDVLEMEYGENEWLEGIQSQVKRLSGLTNDLVYLSRMDETQETIPQIPFPVSDVVEETASAFHAVAQAQKKAFQCTVQPMLSLKGNEKSIRQLVSILLDNAMKYSPSEGEISLTLQKQGRQLRLTVFNTTKEPITRENLSHLFERFYRADSSRNSRTGGYGIGLSVAQAIVTAHNGKITASSKDGQSLEISALFPL